MGKFNINQLLSNTSKNDMQQDTEEKKLKILGHKIIPISVYDLEPSKDNFYSVEQIDELKTSIEMFGVKQNLTVKPIEGGKYKVIAGHRRRLASIALVEEGKKEFEIVPCGIEETEQDEIKERLLMIMTNSTTRQLSDWEKTQQAEELRKLLEELKKREKLHGRMRELIAEALNTSAAQIGRMDAISKNLLPDFKEEFKEQRLGLSTAYEISGLPEEVQQEVFEEYRQKGSLSIKDVKDKKEEFKQKQEEAAEEELGEDQDREKEQTKLIPPPKQEEQIQEEKTQEINMQEADALTHTGGIDSALKPTRENPRHKEEEEHKEKNHQVIPKTEPFQTIFEILKGMTITELAEFICQKCDGKGFCDYGLLCIQQKEEGRHGVCIRWLEMQGQKRG